MLGICRFSARSSPVSAVCFTTSKNAMITQNFVVPECPTFHPSPEEWDSDPLVYIRNVVAPQAQAQAGIAKVVPPASWRVPFSLPNVDQFRFRPRVQVLNALEATVRARGQFVTDLRVFNFWRGHPLSTPLPVRCFAVGKDACFVGAPGGVELFFFSLLAEPDNMAFFWRPLMNACAIDSAARCRPRFHCFSSIVTL
jgi:hypothetical protein